MNNAKDTKISRILTIYLKLCNKELVDKRELAKLFNVSEKSIQRDLEDIRFYFYNNVEIQGYKEIIYDYEKKSYYLESNE